MSSELLKGISAGVALNKAETKDKAAPVISGDVKIKTIDNESRLNEIAKGTELKHVDTVDKAAPKIEPVQIKTIDKEAKLKEIEKGVELKAAETVDKSAPKLPTAVSQETLQGVVKEVEKGASLKHAETVDKAAPLIDKDVHIKKIDRGAILDQIAHGAKLETPPEVHDRSNPAIPPDVKLKMNWNHELAMSEIAKKGQAEEPPNKQ